MIQFRGNQIIPCPQDISSSLERSAIFCHLSSSDAASTFARSQSVAIKHTNSRCSVPAAGLIFAMGGHCSSPARDERRRQKQIENGTVGGEEARKVTRADVCLHRDRLAIRDFQIAGFYIYPNNQKEYEAWLPESRRELLVPFFEKAEASAERLAVARKLLAKETARRRPCLGEP